jgi:hypothetical protein
MKYWNLCLAATLLLGLSACSQQSREISERKHDIDQQVEAQKAMVDQRAAELKETVDSEKTQTVQALDADKRDLDAQKTIDENEKKDVNERAKFLKTNVDQQSAACKKVVNHNAELAKEQIDQYGRRKSLGSASTNPAAQ